MLDPVIALTAQLFLATLLMVSGINQWLHARQFEEAIAAYRLLPTAFTRVAAVLLIATEIAIAIALIIAISQSVALLLAALFALYFVAMATQLWRGNTAIDCGCSLGHQQTPLSQWHLWRNGVLIALSLLLLLPVAERTLHWLETAQVFAALLCAGLLYASIDALLANRTYRMTED